MNRTSNRIIAVALSIALTTFANHNAASADEVIEPSPMAKAVRSMNPVNWKLPSWKLPNFTQMIPGEKKAPMKAAPKQGGFMAGVAKTASSGWNKTKQALNPQKLNPINYLPASSKTSGGKPKESKPGFFRSLFRFGDPEPQPSETVSDFLRQERPGF